MGFSRLVAIFIITSTLLLPISHAAKQPIQINIAAFDKNHLFREQGPIRQLLTEHVKTYLPQYQLAYVDTRFTEFWHSVQHQESICHVFANPHISDLNTIKSKRATLLTPMPAVVMHNRSLKKLSSQNNASAEAILQQEKFVGGYNAGRRYPTYLQQLIDDKISDRNSSLFGGHFTIHQLHQHTNDGQLDYFIGLPQIMPTISGISLNDFTIIPFEVQTPQALYFVCNDSPKHKTFLQHFDRTAFHWYHNAQFHQIWQLLFPLDTAKEFPLLNQFINQQMHD
ncbi:hypothetical protein [Thalassotalea hakodatensis]|uniref:hypothetical protein n=1 Tax=Thalassotalea hakodatensis TaxID=3030492 RepID=UPI002572207F|nr:hypothetical protein [Thalassotalea hakodatensis]